MDLSRPKGDEAVAGWFVVSSYSKFGEVKRAEIRVIRDVHSQRDHKSDPKAQQSTTNDRAKYGFDRRYRSFVWLILIVRSSVGCFGTF